MWGAALAAIALVLGTVGVPPAQAATTWERIGSMPSPSASGSATVMNDGRVLVAGGLSPGATNAAAIFDPATNAWTAAAPMRERRSDHDAALLPDGRVLVAGGTDGHRTLSSAEIYSPATNAWTTTGSLSVPRRGLRMTATPGGDVFVTGGFSREECPDVYATTTIERYDRGAGVFKPWGDLTHARGYHAAASLPDGVIMVAGGKAVDGEMSRYAVYPIELIDLSTGVVSDGTPKPVTGGQGMTLTPLGGDRVLVVPGCCLKTPLPAGTDARPDDLGADVAWIYDTWAHTWTPTRPMSVPRAWHTATMLPDGRVLVAGGRAVRPGTFTVGTRADVTVAVAEVYDPETNTWSRAGDLAEPRAMHVAAPVPGGAVVAGGVGGDDRWAVTATAERFIAGGPHEGWSPVVIAPATGGPPSIPAPAPPARPKTAWNEQSALPVPRAFHEAAVLADGSVLIAGGSAPGTYDLSVMERYTPASDSWASLPRNPRHRGGSSVDVLSDGRVLVAGGHVTGPTTMADVFDPDSGTWSAAASLSLPRSGHWSAVLDDGRVLVFGGASGSSCRKTRTTELYDPVADRWSRGPDMHSSHERLTWTRLPDGRVFAYDPALRFAEIFDPAANRWIVTRASLSPMPRSGATVTSLPDGRVLLVGGCCVSAEYSSSTVPFTSNGAEIFDPRSMTWMKTGAMRTNRYGHSATLLPSGNVLIAGGTAFTTGVESQRRAAVSEIYDPRSGSWSDAGTMPIPRTGHSATLLGDGRVLVAGGSTTNSIETAVTWVHSFREVP